MEGVSVKRRLLATLIGLGMLAGCGKAMPVANQVGAPPQTAESFSVQHGGRTARMFAGLNLTAEQKQQIKDIIVQAHKDRKADKGALKELITAKTVDRDALTAAIEAKLAKHDEMIDRKVKTVSAIREVLTPTQRQTFAKNLTSKGKAKSAEDRQKRYRAKLDRIADRLKMTDVQKAKFEAVLDAYATGSEARHERWAAKKAAMAEFMVSGDEAALKTALQAGKPDVPVAAIVDAVASLDQGQRQRMMAMHRGHRRGMSAACPAGSGDKVTVADADKPEATEAPDADEAADTAEPAQVESGDGQGPDDTRGGEPQEPPPQG
jgi:Spy/CpxP family protein refolding chaperone